MCQGLSQAEWMAGVRVWWTEADFAAKRAAMDPKKAEELKQVKWLIQAFRPEAKEKQRRAEAKTRVQVLKRPVGNTQRRK